MNKNEFWRNPDLTISFLAKTIGSNRTTLSRLIHQHGYSCFQTYVSDYRINAFFEQLPQNRLLNIQGLFYEVGFKSKVTALRHFRRRTGMTPSEYYKKVIMKSFWYGFVILKLIIIDLIRGYVVLIVLLARNLFEINHEKKVLYYTYYKYLFVC